ncbi:response regulator [Sphaerochaeta sp. PS]|uniref:response regulator transcription factor n=1 Tax=Sphaerochaeta sp. PS TaxID=3076336 RepID=UPI0028A4F639|nr:response regulator [Sphaerochaeta sp. PS]MDT4762791.1 response regulator [Sphaerochaeta sp. PS]
MYTLLIIDDETELLEGLSQYFPWEKIGFTVAKAFSDGRAALAFCKSCRVDVVLTDIRMPFISGLDIIQELQKTEKPPLFCIMSAYDSFEYAKKAIEFGVQDYLVKPSSFDDIEKTFLKIRKTLDSSALPATNDSEDDHYAPLINKTLSIMRKRTRTSSLQSIAGELGINSSYLSRLFKEETGQNFQEYLMKLKMEIALQMLTGKLGYTNKDIAKALGYQDTQNFCRTFKGHFGSSPQQYKKERRP